LTRPKIGSIIRYNNWHNRESFFVLGIVKESEIDTRIRVIWIGKGIVDETIACAYPTSCDKCWYSTWYYVEQNPSDTIDNPNYVLSP
jgi:hypothetical protein